MQGVCAASYRSKPRPPPLPPLSKGGGAAAPEEFLPVVDCFPLTAQLGPGMPGPPLYLYRPLPFHTIGADSISARVPSPLRPTNPRVALLYSLYVRAVRESPPP